MSDVSSADLLTVCHELKEQGHQPTVALLRSRSPNKVSVTQAIETIKKFNSVAKPIATAKKAGSATDTASLTKRVTELEAAVALLEQRLARLKPEDGA
ncbi:hypothetical protein [Alteromonas lipotrueiana]|uniref:hypothetical protein n=1 Tax=Alteromonas lipotrueiana TaxID=2803815 RepID=UPI001C4617F6|nr:hypothetical protein [Alteromonas lipotrueiana]